MIRTIIVDDEPGSIITLKSLLGNYCPDVEVVASSGHPLEAISLIEQLKPNLLFLDIEMPFANAFDTLDRLKPIHFEVVFITAFNNYALKAFKYSAIDYLLKPISIEELKVSVDRVKKVLMGSHEFNQRVSGLLENLKRPINQPEVISVPSVQGYHVIELEKIVFIEASGSYAEINFANGNKMMVLKSLKDFEEQLPDSVFIRVHHSYIINIHKVQKYMQGRGGKVLLNDGTYIEVAVRKKNIFLDNLKKIKTNGPMQK